MLTQMKESVWSGDGASTTNKCWPLGGVSKKKQLPTRSISLQEGQIRQAVCKPSPPDQAGRKHRDRLSILRFPCPTCHVNAIFVRAEQESCRFPDRSTPGVGVSIAKETSSQDGQDVKTLFTLVTEQRQHFGTFLAPVLRRPFRRDCAGLAQGFLWLGVLGVS
jgi:hypothetical protein